MWESRERQSPDWRRDSRQSGDWRSRGGGSLRIESSYLVHYGCSCDSPARQERSWRGINFLLTGDLVPGASRNMTEPATPLMRQYHSIKGRYPHALVLFRLG